MKKRTLFLTSVCLLSIQFNCYAQSALYGDVNGDGEVNIADVNAVISVILGGNSQQNEYDYVDLGLPSGTLWATCNVGATNPEDYGDYFAWGETTPKSYYDWNTYKWSNGSNKTLTKYCNKSNYGYSNFVDYKQELDPDDDAATAILGASWRTPSLEQIKELSDYCTWQWTTRNGVKGELGTGPNGNNIFFPASGSVSRDSHSGVSSSGSYWSRRLGPNDPRYAYFLYISSNIVGWNYYDDRCYGKPVRAVRVSKN